MTKPSIYVRASESRKVAEGGRIMSRLVLSPEAAKALRKLQEAAYAASATKCINQALVKAAEDWL